jgi:hypothetical protein
MKESLLYENPCLLYEMTCRTVLETKNLWFCCQDEILYVILWEMQKNVEDMKPKLLWIIVGILILCGPFLLVSCTDDDFPTDNVEAVYTGVPLVIFDTDIGSSTDDLFALEIITVFSEFYCFDFHVFCVVF